MRGLLEAFLLLAPALASAFVVSEVEDVVDGRVIIDRSFALIGVELPSSPDHWAESVVFQLDVLPSEEACGFGNVTVDGQVLPQILDGGISSGKGSITTDRMNIVVASWSFHCIKVNGQPDSQFLKFLVKAVDGKATEEVGFSAVFRQTGSIEIINVETDLGLDDEEVANPNPERLQSAEHEDYFPQFSIEQELDELHWLKAQAKELEYLIWAKEQAINEHASAHFKEDIQDCDSLKCVARAVVDEARKAAHLVFNKIHGHQQEHGLGMEEEFSKMGKSHGHLPELPPKHDKKGNHTCGPPKHGKHGNHTAPPHWKKPHSKPLPICRYPPPHKGGPPDGPPPPPPPHHPPPPHGERPPPPPPNHGPPGDHDGPNHEMEGPHGDHSGPPHDDMRPHDGPHPHDGPNAGPNSHPPDFESEASFHSFENGPPPPFDGPGPHKPPHHNGFGKTFHIVKFVIIGILLSLFVIALHHRTCNPQRRADRLARREERHRRRAFKRAARKHTLTHFLARISGHETDDESDDYEEKRQVLLASAAEDGMSTTMTEEIIEFRNAAEVVDDMVVESSRHSQPIAISTPASDNRPLMKDYDVGSQVGDGEELPAYEDNDSSEMSSVVADGFRYTPGSSEYSPDHSPAGSVSDILGPDTKQ